MSVTISFSSSNKKSELHVYTEATEAIHQGSPSKLRHALSSHKAPLAAARMGALAALACADRKLSESFLTILFEAGLSPGASFWTKEGNQTPVEACARAGAWDGALLAADRLRSGDKETVAHEGVKALLVVAHEVHRRTLDGRFSEGETRAIKQLLTLLAKAATATGYSLARSAPSIIGLALGDWEIRDHLLSLGADINGLDKQGRTPLRLACETGNFSAISSLTSQRAQAGPPIDGVSASQAFERLIAQSPHRDNPSMAILAEQVRKTEEAAAPAPASAPPLPSFNPAARQARRILGRAAPAPSATAKP